MNEQHKQIWSAYIKAKQQFTKRLAQPIPIKKGSCKLRGGYLTAEIEQQKDENELFNIIKKTFDVPETDIHLDKGYFLMPNDKAVSEQQFTNFSEETDKFYLDFEPKPALEGKIKTNEMSNFYQELEKLCIDTRIDRDGKITCTQEQLKQLDTLLEKYNLSRDVNFGCIYNEIRRLNIYEVLRNYLSNSIGTFSIEPNNVVIIKNRLLDKVFCNSLQNTFGFNIIVNFLEFNFYNSIPSTFIYFLKELKYVSIITNGGNKIALLIDNSFDFYDVSRTMFSEIDKMFSDLSMTISNYSIYSFERKNLNFGVLHSLLEYPFYQVSETNNSISFDFQNFEEFEEKKAKILAIKGLKISDYGENHKFKVKLNIINPFQEIQEKLIQKFPNVRCKVNRKNDELKIIYHYKYNPNSSKYELDFQNFIEQECEKHQFNWELNPEIAHTLKFIARVNEDKKTFEENEKFKRLLQNDIKIGGETIGTLSEVYFPELKIKLSAQIAEEQLQNITNSISELTELIPDLTGELEKDARLEDTITKLEGDGKGLANPNIKEFIFNSRKAKPLKNPEILEPESKEWQEIKFHQNPKSNLNDSQIRGVLSSLNAEDLVIIQGPPGTGKSTAISEIIWHHIRTQAKQKILLTSESHLAVDNALDKLGTIPNGLVKPVRFGVDDDVFKETEKQEESKIENEGKRYSYKRFKAWLDSDKETTPVEHYKVLSDNAVQKWASVVGKKSLQQQENHQDVTNFLSDWKDMLENSEQDLKRLFYDNYMANVNIVGATSSSISEVKYTKFKEKEDKKGKQIKQFSKGNFLREYETVFGEVEKEPWDKSPKIKFNVIITDEASKATPPELALPMFYGKKNIVVGDHRQLPPSLDENDFTTTLKNIGTSESRDLAKFFKDHKEEMNISQFEKLFLGFDINSSIRTTFNQQYRMHSSINEVIKQFYIEDGGLFCGLDPEKENIPDFSEPQSRWHGLEYSNFITPETHCIWVNVDTPEVKDGTSRTNYGEIEACEKIIKILQNSKGFDKMQNYWKKDEDKEIGLISFYGTQVGKLWKMTQDKFPNLPIRVKTVDRFQGMERNLLIVSMVRSDKIAYNPEQKPDFDLYENLGFASQTSLGFAELPNRLNVALSRAKRLLIIVGNANHFSQKEIYKNVYESIKNSPHGKIINNIQDFNI